MKRFSDLQWMHVTQVLKPYQLCLKGKLWQKMINNVVIIYQTFLYWIHTLIMLRLKYYYLVPDIRLVMTQDLIHIKPSKSYLSIISYAFISLQKTLSKQNSCHFIFYFTMCQILKLVLIKVKNIACPTKYSAFKSPLRYSVDKIFPYSILGS